MNLSIEQVAELCHEVNREYCRAIGDLTQVPWAEAPQWQRDSAVNGVVFQLNDPLATPLASHENWRRVKQMDGWRYGPVKDVEKKEHPCMVPYGDLPPEQRAKDSLFCSVVASLYDAGILKDGAGAALP